MIEDASRALRMAFRAERRRDRTASTGALDSGEPVENSAENFLRRNTHAQFIGGWPARRPQWISPAEALIALSLRLASEGALQSAHDVSDGGLAMNARGVLFASDGLFRRALSLVWQRAGRPRCSQANASACGRIGYSRRILPLRRVAAQYEVAMMKLARSTRANSASN